MDFINLLNNKSLECNEALLKCFDNLISDKTKLYEAMRYSVECGGKRLRMIMLIESARLFSENDSIAIPFACATEMIHTYSLIHDDLPAMDNAEYRRGKPCNHIVYGDGMAVLAGDGLFHYAFELMAETAVNSSENGSLYIRALYEIAKSAGINGMILGQAIDTESLCPPDMELLKLIYMKKTASMFIGPMKAGAVIAGATESQVDIISQYSSNIGMAFQIIDDILDETGDPSILGKNTGIDQKNNKITISSLIGVDRAAELAAEYIDNSKRIISPLDKYGFFTNLSDYIITRNK